MVGIDRAAAPTSGPPVATADPDAYTLAVSVSPHFGRLDASILWVVTKIFADAHDKRVKQGGYLFLAHLLRWCHIDQLSLFAGTELCDVATICIPNILKLCLNKQQNGWVWSYETTLKYLNLLVAAGVLVTRQGEPGIYYLPLGAYTLLPEQAAGQIAKLAGKRARVSQSAAFQRTVMHCALQGTPLLSPVREEVVQAASKDGFLVDEQELHQAAQAICAVIQRHQGVELLPAAMVEVMQVLCDHRPRLLKKTESRFVTNPKAAALLLASDAGRSTLSDEKGDSTKGGDSRWSE